MKNVRAKIGDVAEISLPDGRFAYAQLLLVHREPPVYGPLWRVLPGRHPRPVADWKSLALDKEDYFVFCPLTARVYRDRVKIVGNTDIPKRWAGRFPLLKATNTGRDWWIWDGEKSVQVKKLTPAQREYSLKEIVTLPLLMEHLMEGWHPRDD